MTILIIIVLFIVIAGVVNYNRSKTKRKSENPPTNADSLFYDVPQRTEADLTDNGNLKKEDFSVAGIQYYEKNISKLARKNPDWEKAPEDLYDEKRPFRKVFEYNYIRKPVYLIPEPTNPHDKNAIMVQIAGQKVGYIYRSDIQLVKTLLQKDVKYISAHINGGNYKTISSDLEEAFDEDRLSITVRIAYS